MRGWCPIDSAEYHLQLDHQLNLRPTLNDSDGTIDELQKKCQDIEKIPLEVAERCHDLAVNAESEAEGPQKYVVN